jgi:hypothetical protein
MQSSTSKRTKKSNDPQFGLISGVVISPAVVEIEVQNDLSGLHTTTEPSSHRLSVNKDGIFGEIESYIPPEFSRDRLLSDNYTDVYVFFEDGSSTILRNSIAISLNIEQYSGSANYMHTEFMAESIEKTDSGRPYRSDTNE